MPNDKRLRSVRFDKMLNSLTVCHHNKSSRALHVLLILKYQGCDFVVMRFPDAFSKKCL